jgi:hypothetical protein
MMGDARAQRLFVVLAAFFVVNAVLAEFIGVKIFALEDTLGLSPFEWNLFGQTGSLNFTAGTLLWPIVFIMTDTVNEYYGQKGVRFISWLAVALILYGFASPSPRSSLAPAGWWTARCPPGRARPAGGLSPPSSARACGRSPARSWPSCSAADRRQRLPPHPPQHRLAPVWLRATGSTAISQLVDSFVVLYIAFVIGPAALADGPVPRGRHAQLHLQDVRGGGADPAAVPGARPDPRLPRPRAGAAHDRSGRARLESTHAPHPAASPACSPLCARPPRPRRAVDNCATVLGSLSVELRIARELPPGSAAPTSAPKRYTPLVGASRERVLRALGTPDRTARTAAGPTSSPAATASARRARPNWCSASTATARWQRSTATARP